MRPARSLKARALQWLAQREQSRVELRRKLLPHALAEVATEAAQEAAGEGGAAARVEAVLDWLEAHGYLSQVRFVESRVHARAARFGNVRIRQELQQHQVALTPEAAQALKDSEWQRACAVHERKFGGAPADAPACAKQARFLAARGFSPEVISRLLRSRRRGEPAAASDDEAA